MKSGIYIDCNGRIFFFGGLLLCNRCVFGEWGAFASFSRVSCCICGPPVIWVSRCDQFLGEPTTP